MSDFNGARARTVGGTGMSGSGISLAEKTDITNRLTAIEGTTIPAVLNDLSDVSGTPASGDLLQYDGSGWVPYTLPATTTTANLGYLIDGGGAAITTGVKYGFKVDFAGTVTLGTAAADVSTTAAIGVWIDTYANFPPTLTDEKFVINMTAATKAKTSTLSVAFAADSFFYFNVGANNNATVLMVSLKITRTL
jgi:hypothetical protein